MPSSTRTNELLDTSALLKRAGIAYQMHVADFGCGGGGHITLQAAKMVGEDGMVYAVDILKPALESVASHAKQAGYENITTVWSNVEMYRATKIPEASLDVALLVNMLFQSQKRKEVLQEVIRLTKPGGNILIVDWKPTGSPIGPDMALRVHPDALQALASSCGLKEQEAFEPGPYHFGILYKK